MSYLVQKLTFSLPLTCIGCSLQHILILRATETVVIENINLLSQLPFKKTLSSASSSRFSAHQPESIEPSAKLSTVTETETSACRRSRLPGSSDVPDPLGPHPSHHGQDRTEHGGLELADGGQAGRSLRGSGCCGALRRREEERGASRPGQLEGEVWLLAFVCGLRDRPRECLEVSLSVRQERWR